MNLNQLETFVVTVEKGTLSAAAEELHLTQPAVSKHLKALEETFGLRLLERSGREVRLTEGGRIFYRRAREVLRLLEQLRRELAQVSKLVRGELLLGASTIPGQYVLPHVIGRFKGRYPGVEVKLIIGGSEDILRRLGEGEIEIGVVGAEERRKGFLYRPLVKDELVLILPPDHPWAGRRSLEAAELAGADWVCREEGSGTRKVVEERLRDAGVVLPPARIVMELGSTEAVVSAVEAGLGVSIVSRWAAEKSLKLGRLATVPVAGVDLERHLFLVHRARELSPAASAFWEFVLGSL
ncbi:selenium metabolism-associated LysR family transcriptional regulator [Thermanaeromonas sp. C210]|uniref:selenium metabolism-associated LysR family transcriptional regulator n=1 Tax=Thermanaeromonas sp. C210 TaxID=2731925 RepID=UPI00155CB2B6|nr:selenium metabolism-associated LysR family transcriptional regulator [Thermanaeromonas sp. C210]GFN22471.1 LysR family transcriptional regulator [Thermanaeromonas sp. C210]